MTNSAFLVAGPVPSSKDSPKLEEPRHRHPGADRHTRPAVVELAIGRVKLRREGRHLIAEVESLQELLDLTTVGVIVVPGGRLQRNLCPRYYG